MWVIRAHRARSLLALLVAAALLFAAGAGLRHRIAHGFPNEPDTAPLSSKTALHSCAALDASALGAALAGRPCVPTPRRQRPPGPGRAVPASAELPFIVHFSARAPPRGLVHGAAPHGGTTGAQRA
jgi:hypothetical protein